MKQAEPWRYRGTQGASLSGTLVATSFCFTSFRVICFPMVFFPSAVSQQTGRYDAEHRAKSGVSHDEMPLRAHRMGFVVSKAALQLGKCRLGHTEREMVCGKRHVPERNAAGNTQPAKRCVKSGMRRHETPPMTLRFPIVV